MSHNNLIIHHLLQDWQANIIETVIMNLLEVLSKRCITGHKFCKCPCIRTP